MEIKQKHKLSLTIIAISLCNLYSAPSLAITCNNGNTCPADPNGNHESIVQQGNGTLIINGDNDTLTGGSLKDSTGAQSNDYTSFVGIGWDTGFPAVTGTGVVNKLQVDSLTLNVVESQGVDRGVQTFLKDSLKDHLLINSANDYANFNTNNSGSLTTEINDSKISLETKNQTKSANTIGINSEATGSGQTHFIKTNNSTISVKADAQSAIGIASNSTVIDDLIHGSTATAGGVSSIGAKSIDIRVNKTDIDVNSVAASATGVHAGYVQNGGQSVINTDTNSSINVITNSSDNHHEANGILTQTNSLGSNATTTIDLSSNITVKSTDSSGGDAYGIQTHSFSNDIENRGELTITSAGAKASGIYSSATLYNKNDNLQNGDFSNRYGEDQKIVNTGDIDVSAKTTATGLDVEGYKGIITIENNSKINVSGDNTSAAINIVTGNTWNSSTPFTDKVDTILIKNSGSLIANSGNNYDGKGIVINAITGVVNASNIYNTGTINAKNVIEATASLGSDVKLRNSGALYGNVNLTQDGNHIIKQSNGIITGVDDFGSTSGTAANVGEIMLGTGDAQYLMTGGILNSNLNMGDGTNIGHISSASKLNNNIKLDGGATRTGDSSKLTLNGQTLTVFTDTTNNIKGVNLINWDNTILEHSIITLDGDLFSQSRQGDLNIGPNSILYATNSGTSTINGNVINHGLINLVKTKNPHDLNQASTLMITGNYTGDPTKPSVKSILIANTVWNENSATSYSDSLHIAGTVTGYTEVKTVNGIIGDIKADQTTGETKYSNDVVIVDDHTANSNKFYGFANTTGIGKAILIQKDANTYVWSLPSQIKENRPIFPIDPKLPGTGLMPNANMRAEYAILASLHQRVGEQQTMAWDDCSTCQIDNSDGQIWGRFLGNRADIDRKDRVGYKSKLWGAQFGYDFNINYDPENNSRSHSGVMLSYARDNLKFYDQHFVYFDTNISDYANKHYQTGHGQADIFGLGGYYTYYDQNGSYLDLVGNLTYIRNKYTTFGKKDLNNHGYGLALSAEVGLPFALTNNGLHNGDWLIEPQAQIIYQYLKYNDMYADDITIAQSNQAALRGRLGFRLAYNTGTEDLKTQTFYFTANIMRLL